MSWGWTDMSITAAFVDSREPSWVQSLTFGSAMTAVTALDYGDLLATCDDGALIAVERKTADDLLGSLSDDRLWPQLVGIRAQTQWAYLVICGRLEPAANGNTLTERGEIKWPWASVQGALLKVQELGVMIVQCASDQDYESTVIRLSARSHSDTVVITPAKAPKLLSEGEQILLSLPGIGPEKVGAIMDYCGTAAWALQFLTNLESTERVPGIGIGIKKKIRAALGLQPEQELAVVISETGHLAMQQEELEKAL